MNDRIKILLEELNNFNSSNIIGLDTETNGLNPHTNDLLSIQLGNYTSQIIIFNKDLKNSKVFNALNKLLLKKNLIKVMHNASFDLKFLWSIGLNCVTIFDTLLAEKLIYCGRYTPKKFFSLDTVLHRNLNIKLSQEKSLRESFIGMSIDQEFTKEQIEYALEDIKFLPKLKKSLHSKLFNMGMAKMNSQAIDTVLGLENNAVTPFARMEYNGFNFNLNDWDKIKQLLKEEVDFRKEELNNIALEIDCKLTESINWNSWQQKLKLLRLIVPDLESTGVRALTPHKNTHSIFKKLINYNKTNKLYTSFALTLPNHINTKTSKIHTNYDQIISTGRVSSYSPNLQQIPSKGKYAKDMRACFIASEGYKIVAGDCRGHFKFP